MRAGIIARMARREASGWLAHAHAWADPRDLALRDLGLTGSYAIATMVGRAVRDMPNTYARRATKPWEDQSVDGLMAGDPAVITALTLARLLQRLARTRDNPFASFGTASATLNQFGPEPLDSARFAHWRGEIIGLADAASGSASGGGEGGCAPLPPVLAAAGAAELRMAAGIVEPPGAVRARRRGLPKMRQAARRPPALPARRAVVRSGAVVPPALPNSGHAEQLEGQAKEFRACSLKRRT